MIQIYELTDTVAKVGLIPKAAAAIAFFKIILNSSAGIMCITTQCIDLVIYDTFND